MAKKSPPDLYKVHNLDARKINELITNPIVDVTITSPPYFDLKDYGHKDQIGYGQKYNDYLSDIRRVFKNVFECTKDTGTLWVIIDTFRKEGEVTPLPFDFSSELKKIGWKLQEIIIWQKDRTVPWAHKGQMRNLFEYILVFSKTNDYKFFIDEVRDASTLKKWWVKYPERYNPKGKTPDGIWNFEIPTQGSWGDGYIKHFCPLPEDMIAQILTLTTLEGDVVLDPFSGSGAVLSKADNMKRKYIGFELNRAYIKMFTEYLAKTGRKKRKHYENESRQIDQNKFRELILNLRALKYAKVLFKKLSKKSEIVRIIVTRSRLKPHRTNSLIVVEYVILVPNAKYKVKLMHKVTEIISKPPLSKFGIEAKLVFVTEYNKFSKHLSQGDLYIYGEKVTHKFKKKIDKSGVRNLSTSEIIVSSIKVDIVENDYE